MGRCCSGGGGWTVTWYWTTNSNLLTGYADPKQLSGLLAAGSEPSLRVPLDATASSPRYLTGLSLRTTSGLGFDTTYSILVDGIAAVGADLIVAAGSTLAGIFFATPVLLGNGGANNALAISLQSVLGNAEAVNREFRLTARGI